MEQEQVLKSFRKKNIENLEVALRMIGLHIGYKYTDLLYSLLAFDSKIKSGVFSIDTAINVVHNWEEYWARHDEEVNKLKNKSKDNEVTDSRE